MNLITTINDYTKSHIKDQTEGTIYPKVAFMTLGCKVNQYETEAMEELFLQNQYDLVNFDEIADVYVVNTCTVTAMSDKKSRQMIRRTKKINPNAIVVVTGCYSQKAPEEVLRISEVNLVMGTSNRNMIIREVLRTSPEDKRIVVDDIMKRKDFEEMNITTAGDHTRAFVKIQDGCDRFCTYCIIPFTRGPVRSRSLENIVYEVKKLVNNGYKEVVLTGIHVASYGKDTKKETLIDVIERLSTIDGLERIRTSSVEPIIITEDFLKRVSQVEQFCPHFHLSLQSGCNKILKKMNRRYTAEEYKNAVEQIRKTYAYPAITTDVIVGFPEEEESDFEETKKFLKEIKLYEMHVFPYSPREGTVAYERGETVTKEEKHIRSNTLISISNQNKKEFMESQIGQVLPVLFETREDDIYTGHTMNYMKVKVVTKESVENMVCDVLLKEAKEDYIDGVIVS